MVLSVVVAALQDTHGRVRLTAAWALFRMRARGESKALVPLLEDPEQHVRCSAAFCLVGPGNAKAELVLLEMLFAAGWGTACELRVASHLFTMKRPLSR